MAICKMPGPRMNWLCEGINLWALQDQNGLMLAGDGRSALVIREDLAHTLCSKNARIAHLVQTYGLREFIHGPHQHLVWDDGMRGLTL